MTDTAVSRDPAEIGTDDPALEKIVVDPQEVAEVKRGRRFVPGPGWRSGVPRYAAIVLFFVAGFSILSALVPFFRRTGSVTRWVSEIVAVPAVPYLTWGVLLWIVAAGLYRRKRVAFRVAFALKALLALVFALFIALYTAEDQLDGIDVSGADLWEAWAVLIGSLIVLVILWLARREFFALVPKGNGRKAFLAFIAGAALTVTVGWLLTAFVPGTLPRESRLTFALGELFSPLGVNVGEQLGGEPPRPIILITGLLGALTLIVAAHFLFRPEKSKVMLTAQDEVGIRGLLRAHGEQDSLGYFATRRDKSAIFSSSGKAAVTYRVLNGVSLASGDPIGDREAWPAAIEAWLEECRRFAWAPAVMGASRYGATAYARSGLQAFHLGDEAILNFHEFNLDGRDSRVVRQAVSRVERAGYTSRVRRHSDIPEAEMLAAVQFCDQTRDTPDERGFSMALGRMNDPADGRCVMVEAFDADGVLQGVLSFSPWGDRGVSLDLMRRARSAENGVVEFMVAALVDAGPRLGIDRASLNFAVLRAVFAEGEEIGAGPVLRFSRATLMFASRWYQLESLYRSNAKYNPEWVPRYLMYETARDLPRVAVASAIAEGFLPEPRLPGISPARPKSPLLAAATGAPMALIAADEAAHAQAEVDDSHRTEDTRLPEQERVRRDKLGELVAAGEDPFFASFQPDTDIASIRAEFADLPAGETTGRHVAIAGRVMRNRITGKLIFAELRDFSGDLQVMLSLRQVGQERLDAWKHAVDLGDLVGVRGEVISSKRGELSVLVDDWVMTAKCLVPLPDKHKGLTDPEARVRQRYVDLIVNDDSRDMLALRARVVRSVRESLWRRGFLEVETPMLQPIHGGANARPFITHINAYDMRLYLRIATELYLKRLLVGGAPKVFEVNRNFRNEGADATHNPEFTALEVYDAYGDYDTMRELTREIILEAAIAAWGRPIIRRPTSDGGFEEVDISGEWAVVTLHEGISRALGTEVTSATELSRLQQLCRDHGIPYESEWDADQVTLEMYERLCEEHTTMPTFYKDFPTGVSPLTRQKPSDPRVAERWDLVAFGAELATAYTELTDPIEQRARLTAQSLLAASGDPEAMELDEDFLRALEYGMPPTGGQGMGIDRLVMFLTGASIRETLLFPIVRPDK